MRVVSVADYRAEFVTRFGREPGALRCGCCGRPLRGKLVELELGFQTGAWGEPGSIPEAESQGCFPLGVKCGRKALARNSA